MGIVVGMWARTGAFSQGTWRTIGNLPVALYGAAVVGWGRSLYVFGGRNAMDTHEYVATFYKINIDTGAVTLLAGSPSSSSWGGRAYDLWGVAHGEYIYFGTTGTTSAYFWRYAPASDTWTQMATPITRTPNGTAAVINGVLYVANGDLNLGGVGPPATGVAGYTYSLEGNTWSAMPVSGGTSFAVPEVEGAQNFRATRPILAEHGGKLLVSAGRLGGSVNTYPTREFNPATGRTALLAALPSTSTGGGLWPQGGKTPTGLVVSGGASSTYSWGSSSFGGVETETAYAGTYHYSRELNAWTVSAAPAPHPVGQAGFAVHNLRLYAVGGVTNGHAPVTAIQEYIL